MLARLECLWKGHFWWVEGYAEDVYPRGTVYCYFCGALAAGSRRAKTPRAVECKASQSGGDSRNAQGDIA